MRRRPSGGGTGGAGGAATAEGGRAGAGASSASSSVIGARSAAVSRKTKETAVDVRICIDGTGQCSSRTSIPFLDHMMDVRCCFFLARRRAPKSERHEPALAPSARPARLLRALVVVAGARPGRVACPAPKFARPASQPLSLHPHTQQLASHGLFDLSIAAAGDTWIDDHHTNEDIGLALGSALAQALGDRRGIVRFGDFTAPLDEALVAVTLDLSGRPHLSCDLALPTERIGTYDTQLVEHFFQSLVNTSGLTLHIRQLAGTNSHHIVEATFKAFARALRAATEADPRRGGRVASSKGVLTQN